MKTILFLAIIATLSWSEIEACGGGGGGSGSKSWIGGCWETWSRCTRWSNSMTGILWKSCSDRCKELGHTGGSCKLSKSNCPLSSKAYQCQCF
uniref:Mytimacin-2 n=1 Tax=Mytilus galloprovincialis TaxID=29158 RepID=G4U4K5_MYTGA|nr:mytimacin-2 [Mytilus galloprovincialis]